MPSEASPALSPSRPDESDPPRFSLSARVGDLLWCLGTATECASECADGADLDQIKALLASVDLGDVG